MEPVFDFRPYVVEGHPASHIKLGNVYRLRDLCAM